MHDLARVLEVDRQPRSPCLGACGFIIGGWIYEMGVLSGEAGGRRGWMMEFGEGKERGGREGLGSGFCVVVAPLLSVAESTS